ncbi:MAG: pentapeptide repeat-containing protein [Bacteroidota bacterium]
MADLRQYELSLQELYETCSDTDPLEHLAEVLGLDPSVDFEGADLRHLNVKGEDLTNFNFRGADLRESDLRKVKLRRKALSGANLEGAKLNDVVWVGPPEIDRYIFDWGDAWSEVPESHLEELIKRVSPVDGKYRLDLETSRVFQRNLPFYKNVRLLAFIDPSWSNPNLVIYYLKDKDSLYRLNGTSTPMHEVNAKAPIKLNEDNVLEYFRFFLFMLRDGDKKPFRLLENIEVSELSGDLDKASKILMEDAIRSASFDGLDDENNFLLSGTVLYENYIAIVNSKVQLNGMIEFLDDEPIVEDLPVKWNIPISQHN